MEWNPLPAILTYQHAKESAVWRTSAGGNVFFFVGTGKCARLFAFPNLAMISSFQLIVNIAAIITSAECDRPE